MTDDLPWQFDNVSEDEQQLLFTRSMRLQKKEKAQGEENGLWVASFPLGSSRWALPMHDLLTCLPLKGIIPVPRSNATTLGLIRFQGRLVTVFSLAALLGVQGWKVDPSVLLILRGERDHLFAVDCEEVPQTVLVTFTALETARKATRGEHYSLPVTMPNNELLQLIELPKLMEHKVTP